MVSHDRYLIARVTDQQYAVLDGELRHLPGGVEEYLALSSKSGAKRAEAAAAGSASAAPGLSGAELRAAQKEGASLMRRIEKLTVQLQKTDAEMEQHDPGDYDGILALGAKSQEQRQELDRLEGLWLEASERLE